MKILAKDILCEYECKFDEMKCNSNQWWNNDKCECGLKIIIYLKKDYIWNPSTCICENEKYSARIMENPVILCDEIIDTAETKIIPIKN